MKTPNILFLMSDEHRFDIAGFAGNSIVKTPTLDYLAKDAVCFSNAYTPSPVCIPARQCLATGCLPENCNCSLFGEDIAPNSNTFARVFAQNAYKTCACGKLHHLGIDQMQGWTQRVAPDCEISDAFIADKNEDAFKEYASNSQTKHYTESGRGKNQWEIERAGVGRGPYQIFDEHVISGAIEFIEQYFTNIWYDRVMKSRPLLLKVSLLQPHYPFLCEEDKFKYYMNRVPIYDEKVTDHEFLELIN